MELPYGAKKEARSSKHSSSLSKVKEENDCIEIEDSCEEPLFSNDIFSVYTSSSDDEIYGFDSPKKDKHNYIVNLMKKIEAEESGKSLPEKDVIDGIEFLSFFSKQELMDYAKTQQDLRANASDDGLEILDDGTFSDISSNHAIVPTKTKDITRIKGWRNKHFAGINECDDSGSSLRNDDDGFGDDFEIKSVQDESSEELESVGYAASITSRNGLEGDTSHDKGYKRIDSPVIEDTNAVDNAEGFALKKSNKNLSSSINSYISKKNITSNTSEFSFDDFDMKGIFTSDNLSNISPGEDFDQLVSRETDSFLSPLTPQDKKSKSCFDSKVVVYKPRVKQGFLERLARKVSADNFDNIQEQNISTMVSCNRAEKGIRWCVSKEKLLSGNIYDVEVSMSPDKKITDHDRIDTIESQENTGPESCQKDGKKGEYGILSTKEKVGNENISAFQSTTLEHYTTNLDKLHIDFTIPKLEAADTVTHEEIVLPVTEIINKLQQRQKQNPVDEIRAKTVAEKRRLLTEYNFNQRSKRKQKLSFKIRANNENRNLKRVKRLRGRIENNTKHAQFKVKGKRRDKKPLLPKVLFDEQGVITYGREQPLKSAFNKGLKAFIKTSSPLSLEKSHSSPLSSKIGMIINIGVLRPLYKEVSDNVNKFLFDDNGNITPAYAAFSSSAVQNSLHQPYTVKRILVPVVDETLQKVVFASNKRKHVIEKLKNLKSSLTEENKLKPSFSFNLFKERQRKMSVKTNQFVEDNEIDRDVCDIMNEMLEYVDSKEYFENFDYSYDPDVPVSTEKENIELFTLKTMNNKKKKTKLQIQIERLGGTFIAVQGEEGNEENLSHVPEENVNCTKDSCKMGCVCYHRMLRDEHCGKEACIFSCQCPPFSRRQGCEIKSKIWLLPEVLRHHNVSQSKLAPVEREYHQTVIMSKDNKITIETKHRKRERKLPSKYKDEIMFDFRKGNNHDEDENDILLVEDEIMSKQLRQTFKEQPDCYKKRQFSPMILSNQTILENSTIAHNYGSDIKECSVRIEKNPTINQMAAELTFTCGVHIDKQKNPQPTNKKQRAKMRSRNVARKKTGSFMRHIFDVENFSSRTYGATEDYVLRNFLGKIRTKDFLLYPSKYHGSNNFTPIQQSNIPPIIKEDLVERSATDTESENEIEEKTPNEEERGLQIEFVHSIPPHLFEDQVYEGDDHKAAICNNSQISDSKKEVEDNVVPVRPQRFVYAVLPKTEIESRWWVVELDQEKFTDLVFYSEKRALSFAQIKKTIFDAEYSNATIKLVLNHSKSPFKDKFGAYIVGGHKHLIFFGPYELSESHGITAIRNEGGEFIHVPFTSKFSESENFKSLGIDMTSVKENSQSILKSVNAVWWYSTGKRGFTANDAGSRCTQQKSNRSTLSQDKIKRPYQNEVNCSRELKENDTFSSEAVEVIEDDITIEQDLVKIEPFDYEDSMSTENRNNTHASNAIDFHNDTSNTDSQKNIRNSVSEQDLLIINRIESVEDPINIRNVSSRNNRSILKKNVAKMKTSSVNKSSSLEKKDAVIVQKQKDLICESETSSSKPLITHIKNDLKLSKKRKRKALTTRRKQYRKDESKKEDICIRSLRKKIENLNEAIMSKKLKTREEIHSPENISEIDFESDSSSLSDVDFYKDITPEKPHDDPIPAKETKIKRIVHRSPKITPKSQEPAPGLPQNLLLKMPKEGPCPEKALLSLTPGIGYISVIEFDPMDGHLVIQDPCDNLLEHFFQNKSLAVDWLNQFFLKEFTFKPKFDMQWVIVTGSIIRMLQPLNKDIFKYKAKSLIIRPCGLELGRSSSMDQDLLDWERRELSLLRRRIATYKINNNKNIDQQQNVPRSNVCIENTRKTERVKKTTNYVEKSPKDHNLMERMRRSELSELMSSLGEVALPENKPSKLVKQNILTRATYVCEAQKIIEEKLKTEKEELKKTRDMLNQKLKNIFAGILNHEEKKKALEVCKFIRCNQYKLPDMRDKYMKDMRVMEDRLIETIRKINVSQSFSKSSAQSSMRSSSSSSNSSSGSLHSVQNIEPRTLNSTGVQSIEPRTPNSPGVQRIEPRTPNSTKRKKEVGKQPTEGVLVKSKLRALTATRPDLNIYPASLGGEVINLVDDNGSDDVIEIVADEEDDDVVWLPPEEQSQQVDDDVVIVSSNIKSRRPRLKFPKPLRKLPEPYSQRSLLNFRKTLDTSRERVRKVTLSPRVIRHPEPVTMEQSAPAAIEHSAPVAMEHSAPVDMEHSASVAMEQSAPAAIEHSAPVALEHSAPVAMEHPAPVPMEHPAPVAMVLSPAVMERHNLQAAPEFVAVDELDYEPLFCEFKSGCSRTDPVSDKYLSKFKSTHQQFIPIQQTSIVNYVNKSSLTPKATSANPPLQRKLMTPFARLQQIKLNNITPIGHISQNGKLSSFKGRPVLLRKSIGGIQLSKIPTIQAPVRHLTPLSAIPVTITNHSSNASAIPVTITNHSSNASAVPVTITNNSSNRNSRGVLSPESANTVTLYHPSEDISVTKTVQFANLNSVHLDMPSTSVLSGPKIRKPKVDNSPRSIKILLPKRS